MLRQPGLWQVAWLYLGTLVGAGFATGREILRFFAAYGGWGVVGAVVTGLLFAAAGAATTYLAGQAGARDYHQYFAAILPAPWASLLDALTSTFFFMVLAVTVAGMAQLLADVAPVAAGPAPFVITAAILALVLAGPTAALTVGRRLGPFLLVLIMLLCGATLVASGGGLDGVAGFGGGWAVGLAPWWLSALLYFSYNHALSLAVLTTAAELSPPRMAAAGAALGGLLLGLMLAAATTVIIILLPHSARAAFPLAYAATRLGAVWSSLYTGFLAAAMLTTAVAVLWALGQRHAGVGRLLLLALAAAAIAARGSFTGLVDGFYPIMGAAGTLAVVALLRALLLGGEGIPPHRGE